MINVFKHNDPHKIRTFRTATFKEDSGIETNFRYYKLDREDIIHQEYLKNIEMQSYQMIIRTFADYKYTTHTKISIDGVQYMVSSIYTEEQIGNNGPFRKRVKPAYYLVLKR